MSDDDAVNPDALPGAYGLYRSQSGGPALEIYQRGDVVSGIPYGEIKQVSTYKGGLLVILTHGGILARIEGENLGTLRSKILRSQVAFICENRTGPDQCAIDSITIEYISPLAAFTGGQEKRNASPARTDTQQH